MGRYVINGKFLADRMQGIVRYAREMVNALDECLEDEDSIFLLVPQNAKNIPELKKIKIEIIGSHTGIMWEQIDLRNYLHRNRNVACINFCNVCPLFVQPGITTIHDIMYKVRPNFYSTFRNRISRIWHVFQYWYVTRHEKCIVTVSNFSKGEIEKYYPRVKGKIVVIPNGWQHVIKYNESQDWFEKYPFLRMKEYFFSLSTLSRNKNGKWIIENAKYNSDYVYAIAGKYYETDKFEIPENVHLLGFVSDEDACALIKNCRAFIYPSLYEGFGIPPLEALALGAEVISSNATSLPEVLDDAVHYIDPENAKVNIELILSEKVSPPNKVLDRFNFLESARKLKSILI